MNINDLLTKEAGFILKKITDNDPVVFDKGFNWLGLAEVSESKADLFYKKKCYEEGGKWFDIALYSYSSCVKKSENGDTFSLENSMARIKIKSVNIFDVSEKDKLLALESVFEWFKSKVNLSLEDALLKSNIFLKLQKIEILELRRIKNMLSTIDLIKDKKLIPNDIKEWLKIKSELP